MESSLDPSLSQSKRKTGIRLCSFFLYIRNFLEMKLLACFVTVRSMNSTHSGIITSNEIDSVSISDGEEVRS